MRKATFTMFATLFIASAVLMSCNNSTKKVDQAQENVSEAKEDLNEAKKDYEIEIENYRKETYAKISDNDKIIADFKSKIERQNKSTHTEYHKEIAPLEERNKELKKKMDNYKDEGKDQWESFKSEFNHDMDDLGKAFKNLTLNNVK